MKTYKLYGAILGDLAGQPYEFPPMKGPYTNVDIHNPNSHITDDTIMTLASAHSILCNWTAEDSYMLWGNMYPDAGYGEGFKQWLKTGDIGTSWGNGCLMRASPFMYAKDLPGLIKSVQCSHNHEDSLRAIFILWNLYQCSMHTGLVSPKQFEKFEVNALATIAFCECAADYNRSTQVNIVNSVYYGGDTDTNASIIGELSNFWHKDITKKDAEYVESKLDKFQIETLLKFNKT